MIGLFVLAQVTTQAPAAAPPQQATASVRIERPALANARSWRETPANERREVRRVDERGQTILIRVVDYP